MIFNLFLLLSFIYFFVKICKNIYINIFFKRKFNNNIKIYNKKQNKKSFNIEAETISFEEIKDKKNK